MPRGTRHRLTGLLLMSARGPVLQMDDGGIYALDLDRAATDLVGQRVTVEGVRSRFDRIDVEWLGPADRRS
ncbi:MAG: hypothetical protein J7500_14780 [Sphingomonas sp.]|uniref:DUF5818 domain-containing protein n=1 Tax=Sphingomonas sp. TaxID=28214 RepID=UPI001B14970A|nr:DUF5818 domain-containing protein [Sphingomonas sp.]MBO9623972.1 hypothetical protein [Sphingomonas sp.]